MKLIASLTSPYARKARVVLAEKHIDYELILENPWESGTQVPAYNPLGKIPVLVLDDGTNLFDSRVIVEYLDAISPVRRLIPSTTRPKAEVKRWEALADGVLDAGVAIIKEKGRPTAQQSPDWIRRQHGKILMSLKAMSEELAGSVWCTGDKTYNLADIAVGCALGYLAFRFPEIAWQKDYPNLAALYEKLMELPSFIDTVPVA